MRYILAFYELDRVFGGPEEGSWWFDTGALVRIVRVEKNKARAYTRAARANRLLDRLQRDARSLGSVLYNGGRHRLCVLEHTAPANFPQHRPRYE